MTEDDINDLIDDCINRLCDDNAELGAESLTELATHWAMARLTKQSFLDMRQFIIQSSIERLGTSATQFIQYKLQVAERDLKNKRYTSGANNGHIIIH